MNEPLMKGEPAVLLRRYHCGLRRQALEPVELESVGTVTLPLIVFVAESNFTNLSEPLFLSP